MIGFFMTFIPLLGIVAGLILLGYWAWYSWDSNRAARDKRRRRHEARARRAAAVNPQGAESGPPAQAG